MRFDMSPSTMLRKALVLAALLLVLLVPVVLPAKDLPTASLTVQTKAGQQHRFTVELAISNAEQTRGLMYRERMAPDAGMLFLYDTPIIASFWMKNTILSLDLIFIEKDGTIANIYADAEPGNLTPIRSTRPVTGVLEINAGLAARLGIHPGDRVLYKAFGTAP
jgi:uncharacterized membrane protein (UPF0127 family)